MILKMMSFRFGWAIKLRRARHHKCVAGCSVNVMK